MTQTGVEAYGIGNEVKLVQFGINDEIVYTGFLAMIHYLIAIGVGINNKQDNLE